MSKRVILGAAVKAIREAKSKNDEKYRTGTFALACDMTPGHLCNIEAGRKFPPTETVERIAAALEVSVDAISYIAAEEAAA